MSVQSPDITVILMPFAAPLWGALDAFVGEDSLEMVSTATE